MRERGGTFSSAEELRFVRLARGFPGAGRDFPPINFASRAEADMDEFRAGIHNDRGFGNDFRSERGQAA